MVSKKNKLLLGVLLLLSSGVSAQVGGNGSVYDSSVITRKRMPQANEFWNNSYNFPAKPRNMWEIGASVGLFTISGDLPAVIGLPDKIQQTSFEAHVRKAFGYVFSLRLQYVNGWGKGQAWTSSDNFNRNPAWNVNLPAGKRYFSPQRNDAGQILYTDHNGVTSPVNDHVYYNYKTHLQDLGIQGIVTLNNIRFHKQKTGIILYAGGGIGATIYNTMINALGSDGNNYRTLFNNVYNQFGTGAYTKRKDILKALRAGMDNTYETSAENAGVRRPKIGKNTLKPSGTVLAGVAIKLGKRINLAIEDRWSFVKDDLLDGQQWQEQAWGDPALTRDFDSYNYASIGLNFNLGAKSVEPLWWLNPLDYAYDELMNHRHVKIPKNDCPDSDGDGVCDHLDREPNTPAGCPVDTHGVSRDTDGDGVPDCIDKELITPTICQPVDKDGIGKCPDPECCKKNPSQPIEPTACVCDYPSLTFDNNATTLNMENKSMLATIAAKMKERPNCNITLVGISSASKSSKALCEKRLNAAKDYLQITGGIAPGRVSVNCEVKIDVKDSKELKKLQNNVDIKCN